MMKFSKHTHTGTHTRTPGCLEHLTSSQHMQPDKLRPGEESRLPFFFSKNSKSTNKGKPNKEKQRQPGTKKKNNPL